MQTMGIYYCCVKGCFSNTTLTNITLFRFPKDHERCLAWARSCGRKDILNFSPIHIYNNYKVCSLHFENEMLSSLLKNRLKKNAIPTIFKSNVNSEPPQPSTSHLTPFVIEHVPANIQSNGLSLEQLEPNLNTSCAVDVTLITPENLEVAQEVIISPSDDSSVQTQTPTSLTSQSPCNPKFSEEVRKLKRKLFQQESQAKRRKIGKDDVIKFCKDHFSEGLVKFIKANLDLQQRNSKDYRYSNDYKQFALTIYFLGPEVYKFLSNMFCLPSKSTIYRITTYWNITSGLNEQIFTILKSRVSTMDNTDRDCILSMDEMSIKKFLFYNRSRDEIIGFHETLDDKSYEPAKSVFVLMARGISQNWKQPIAFFFVNSISEEEVEKIVFETIRRLQFIGLNILAIISDLGKNFVKFTKRNSITDENPFFFVNNKKIFYMFDVPHLLKALRNNFFKYGLKVKDMVTNKEYLEIFYNRDKQSQIRLAPKLTDDHINPNNVNKLKVKLAVQVLSATVAAALYAYVVLGALPAAASFTATFIEKIDNLFDIFNSSKVNGVKDYNRPFIGSERQISFLNEMHCFFCNMKVLDNSGKDITDTMKFIDGWKISIKAFLNMWEVLKERHSTISTRRMNQDCLEDFFGKIREQFGNCRSPTPNQFSQGFKKMFCLHYFESASGTNFIDDFDKLLLTVTPEKIKCFENVLFQKMVFSNLEIDAADYISIELPKNALNYVSGYLMKKCLEKHECDICTNYAKEHVNLSEDVFFSYFKAYEHKNKDTFGNLMMPPDNFVEFIYTVENKFYQIFPSLSIQKSVGIKIKEELKNIVFPHKCEKFPLDYLLSLYVRMRVFFTLKYINRGLRTVKNIKNDKLSILKNL